MASGSPLLLTRNYVLLTCHRRCLVAIAPVYCTIEDMKKGKNRSIHCFVKHPPGSSRCGWRGLVRYQRCDTRADGPRAGLEIQEQTSSYAGIYFRRWIPVWPFVHLGSHSLDIDVNAWTGSIWAVRVKSASLSLELGVGTDWCTSSMVRTLSGCWNGNLSIPSLQANHRIPCSAFFPRANAGGWNPTVVPVTKWCKGESSRQRER
jgi:hypothetical protein